MSDLEFGLLLLMVFGIVTITVSLLFKGMNLDILKDYAKSSKGEKNGS